MLWKIAIVKKIMTTTEHCYTASNMINPVMKVKTKNISARKQIYEQYSVI